MGILFHVNNNTNAALSFVKAKTKSGSHVPTPLGVTIPAKGRTAQVDLPDDTYTLEYRDGKNLRSITFQVEGTKATIERKKGFVEDAGCQPPNWWIDAT